MNQIIKIEDQPVAFFLSMVPFFLSFYKGDGCFCTHVLTNSKYYIDIWFLGEYKVRTTFDAPYKSTCTFFYVEC